MLYHIGGSFAQRFYTWWVVGFLMVVYYLVLSGVVVW